MQLHIARLCLDCEEVHDAQVCPRCTSESFALLSRWIPVRERRARPRPQPETSDAETYRQLLAPEAPSQPSHRWLMRGALLTAVGVGGWLWRQKTTKPDAAEDVRRQIRRR
jgi:hypothetical protein